MDWVFDNLNVIFFLAAGVAYWLNSMRQAKEEARQQREAEEMMEEYREEYVPPPQTEVFLPPPVAPPPLPGQPMARPPQVAPPLKRAPAPQVAMAQEAYQAELERQKALEERLLSLRQNRENRSGGAAATKRAAAKRNAVAPGAKTEAAPAAGIRARLRDRSEARHAMVMREILGTPVGMR